jgi:hypothetical protein
MAQANADPTSIPVSAELHRSQSSPEGMIAAHVVDLISTVAELEKLAGNPALFRLIAAELAYLHLVHGELGRPALPRPRRGGMNAFERHGIDHLSASSLNLWRASPGLWCARYLADLKEDGNLAMWRGTAVEAGIAPCPLWRPD